MISGFAEPDRARVALGERQRLPQHPRWHQAEWPGYQGSTPPRWVTNLYAWRARKRRHLLHANPWVMIAETLIGNGTRSSLRVHHQINPARRRSIDELSVSRTRTPEILGDEHPEFASLAIAGSAGRPLWTYTAATKYILGIRPRTADC